MLWNWISRHHRCTMMCLNVKKMVLILSDIFIDFLIRTHALLDLLYIDTSGSSVIIGY